MLLSAVWGSKEYITKGGLLLRTDEAQNFPSWSFILLSYEQSHYREVARWEIFMKQGLRFGLDLGRFRNF